MSDSIDLFRRSLSENGFSPNTVRAYAGDVTSFLAWAGPMYWPNNAERVARQYVTTMRESWKPKTTRRKVSAIRAYARHLGYSPFMADYRPPKPAPAQPHPLPGGINDVMAILEECRTDHHRALIALCGLAGLRVGEALTVTSRDFDLTEMTLLVHGKGAADRVVPITKPAWFFICPAMAAAHQSGLPIIGIKDRAARAFVTRAGRRAALLRDAASHDLRATFLTTAYQRTKDIRAVQDLAGHASMDTTRVYTGITMADMRKAAEVLGS